jgi:hypothetical protein
LRNNRRKTELTSDTGYYPGTGYSCLVIPQEGGDRFPHGFTSPFDPDQGSADPPAPNEQKSLAGGNDGIRIRQD